MCLAVPGEIISISGEGFSRIGRVRYGGAVKEASLAFTPAAQPGDYVLVHAGVAINTIDAGQARTAFDYLDALVSSESQGAAQESATGAGTEDDDAIIGAAEDTTAR